MKTKIILTVATLFVARIAAAQDPGVYTIGRWNGESGTNAAVAPASSSVTNTIVVDQYNSAGLQFTMKADTASTANVIIRTYRSASGTYETTGATNLLALNGTTQRTVFIELNDTYLNGCGSLRVVLDNTNAATVSLTNIQGLVRYKSNQVRFRN